MAIIGTTYFGKTNGVDTSFGTTPPTAAQAFYMNQLVVQLTAGDGDTTCSITHNWNLSAAQQTGFRPNISYVPGPGSTGTLMPILAFTWSTNAVTVAKISAVGSQGIYICTLNRPLDSNL